MDEAFRFNRALDSGKPLFNMNTGKLQGHSDQYIMLETTQQYVELVLEQMAVFFMTSSHKVRLWLYCPACVDFYMSTRCLMECLAK